MTFILASGTDPLGHVIDKNSAFTDLFGFDVQLSVVSVVVGALIVVAASGGAARTPGRPSKLPAHTSRKRSGF